jgi:uncharacterized protein (TIGR02246 family)
MKNIFLGISIAFFLMCGNAMAQTKAEPSADEKAINATMTEFGKAWTAGDMNKLAEYLTEDCVHINPYGQQFNGREAYKNHLKWVIDNFYPTGTPKIDITEYSARLVSPDAAIVNFLNREEKHSTRMTLVLTKAKTGWKIALVQLVHLSEQGKPGSK